MTATCDCEICQGRGTIELPIRRRLSAVPYRPDAVMAIEASSKSFPCPECAPSAPADRLAIVRYHAVVNMQIRDPAFLDDVKASAAHSLVEGLLRGGYVTFKRGPECADGFTYEMVASIGVVAPAHVATFEQRVAEHQEALAREVMAEAVAQIQNWGSHYGHRTISKEQAYDSVASALKAVLAKRAKVRAA